MSYVKDHVISLIIRDNPGRKSYYKLVFADQTFDELINYKLTGVYNEVPEGGFRENERRPKDLNVCEYFNALFKDLEDKL